jgi:hypothetical protein
MESEKYKIINNTLYDIDKSDHYFSRMDITEIMLPDCYQDRYLYLNKNLISSVIIPYKWKVIYIDNNPLNEISFKDPDSIEVLYCLNTQLKTLPSLINLRYLNCANTPLEQLPHLPSLKTFRGSAYHMKLFKKNPLGIDINIWN